MRLRTCPACQSEAAFRFRGGDLFGCPDCQLVGAVDRETTAEYNEAYVAERYDRYPTTNAMSERRLCYIEMVLGLYETLEWGVNDVLRGPLLDVGYGNGSFIRTAIAAGWDAYGHDVNPTEYEGVRRRPLPGRFRDRQEGYRVVTFWDCLEHFEELDEVRWITHHTDWLFLAFPFRPEPTEAAPYPDRLRDWKHFRPGEHHFYFVPETIARLFSHHGVTAQVVHRGHHEDVIRTPSEGHPNIQTMALRCFRS